MANKYKYISIDSDILRTFVFFDEIMIRFKKKNPDFSYLELDDNFDFSNIIDFKDLRDKAIIKNARNLFYIYLLCKKDKLRIYITEEVYYESKHLPNAVNFIKYNCFMHKMMTESEKSKWLEEVDNLVEQYTTKQTTIYKGKVLTEEAPMKKVYSAYNKTLIPENDVYIMAESTVDRCILLTNNGKDYIFNLKDDKYMEDPKTHRQIKKKSRSVAIANINLQNGYYTQTDDDFYVVPKPIDINTLAKHLRYKGLGMFNTPTPKEEDFTYAANRIGF